MRINKQMEQEIKYVIQNKLAKRNLKKDLFLQFKWNDKIELLDSKYLYKYWNVEDYTNDLEGLYKDIFNYLENKYNGF